MQKPPEITRPTFGEAFEFWQRLLAQRGFPAECQWLFEENLCFEQAAGSEDLKLHYQLRFTPPPPGAERVAYDYFSEFEAPVVFYRVGAGHGKSLCAILCDSWFSGKGEAEGFVRKDDWLMLFHPGAAVELEEITDLQRWKTRVVKKRRLHDVDFSMTLRAVHETLAHGRVLSTYEYYALRFLHRWKEFARNKTKLS
jgi:hypothetical protein